MFYTLANKVFPFFVNLEHLAICLQLSMRQHDSSRVLSVASSLSDNFQTWIFETSAFNVESCFHGRHDMGSIGHCPTPPT